MFLKKYGDLVLGIVFAVIAIAMYVGADARRRMSLYGKMIIFMSLRQISWLRNFAIPYLHGTETMS